MRREEKRRGEERRGEERKGKMRIREKGEERIQVE